MKKHWLCSILSVALVATVTGCGSSKESASTPTNSQKSQNTNNESAAKNAEFVLKLGHTQGGDHPYQKAAEKLKQLVEEKSKGKIKVEIYPNSQLGSQREMVEGLQLGTIQLHIGTLTAMANFSPKFNVVTLPYLFRDADHAEKVMKGEVGKELAGELETKGISVLSYWDNGWRHMTNNIRPIKTAADVKGLRIRVQESPTYISFIKALGATPTPIPFGELYTALEQKVVDGQEQPLAQMATNKFYEVQKYLTLTAHTYEPAALYISKQTYDKMPAELQQVLVEAAKEAGDYEHKLISESDATYLKQMKDGGTIVEEHPDIQSFRTAVDPVYKEFEAKIGKDLIDKIRNTK